MIEIRDFLKEIEEIVLLSNTTYIDAIVECASKNELEIEFLAGLVKKDKTLKAKIEVEATRLNFLKTEK